MAADMAPILPKVDAGHDDVLRQVRSDVGRETVQDAREAAEAEKAMGFVEAIKLYPKAAAWSVVLSTAIVMEGYDTALISSFYGFPQFAQRYGKQNPDTGAWYIPSPWQAGLSNGVVCGEIVGLLINGVVSERFGYRRTMIGALSALTAFIFLPVFAPDIQTLLAGEILLGVPWGIFQTLATAYASEVCPVALRAYLCTYVNLCWVFGQLIASGVLRAMLDNATSLSYRLPFALQWIWPIPLIIGCMFAPESPWWLVRRNRLDEARHALRRLTSPPKAGSAGAAAAAFDVDKTLAMIRHTNELEKSISAGTSYLDCFKGADLRRTEIACCTWAVQNLCGSAFMGFSVLFYERAGLAVDHAFDLTMAQYGIGAIGTILSWFLMRRIGRRTIYLAGELLMLACLLVIGVIGAAAPSAKGASWVVGSMLLAFTFIYDTTVGSVCYVLVAEVASTRLRSKTIVLARTVFNLIAIVNWFLTPYQLGQDEWNWGAKTGLFWAGILLFCIVWTYYRLPEPRGRTYAELDVLFERRTPARQFASASVVHLLVGGDTPADTPIKEKDDPSLVPPYPAQP